MKTSQALQLSLTAYYYMEFFYFIHFFHSFILLRLELTGVLPFYASVASMDFN